MFLSELKKLFRHQIVFLPEHSLLKILFLAGNETLSFAENREDSESVHSSGEPFILASSPNVSCCYSLTVQNECSTKSDLSRSSLRVS